ncbi:MAG: aminoglycoside phosphotransferase family protein [Acidobacteriota bacterium]
MADPTSERIARYLDAQGLTGRVSRVVRLTGDASDRRYLRVWFRDGDSIVLALHAGPIDYERMAFVRVAALLELVPLPVPRILHHSNELGIIGLEDLGDVTLQAHLGASDPGEHDALYRQAVAFIARLQIRGAELRSDEYPPYGIAFDVEKLTWELEFFVKHFLIAYRSLAIPPSVRLALSAEWREIVEELAAEPRVLCHRDYHSRNLMVREHGLCVIDFQDARMGPDCYDLVSLLRDSYVDLAARQVDELTTRYLAETRGASLTEAERTRFARRFDLMALQRNLKALGTFGYQTVSRDNPVYLQYVPRTLSYVRANLARHPRFGRLRDLLAGLVEEFGEAC